MHAHRKGTPPASLSRFYLSQVISMDLQHTIWNQTTYQMYQDYLAGLADPAYRDFSARLIPDTPQMLGVRVPVLRTAAKQIARGDAQAFLACEKSPCHEEIIMEGLVIGYAKLGFGAFCEYTRRFAQKVYNWAICDIPCSSMTLIRKFRTEYLIEIDRFLHSSNPWEQRVGVILLLDHYLVDGYLEIVFSRMDSLCSDFYYVQMAQAWLLATAFAKFRSETLAYLQTAALNAETFRLTVKKVQESSRIAAEDKILVKQLR